MLCSPRAMRLADQNEEHRRKDTGPAALEQRIRRLFEQRADCAGPLRKQP